MSSRHSAAFESYLIVFSLIAIAKIFAVFTQFTAHTTLAMKYARIKLGNSNATAAGNK
jgi:hypothetical protein